MSIMKQYLKKNSPLYILYTVYKYFVLYPVITCSSFFFGFIALFITFMWDPDKNNIAGVWWARVISFFTPMHVSVSGWENLNRNQSYVIVSNHQSQYDIYLLYGWLKVNFRWVIKAEFRSIPFVGFTCEKMGHIFIDRNNGKNARQIINKTKNKIKNGISILFFPEGTRNQGKGMMEFKKGAFWFAIENKLPILPVTLVNTRNILPPNSTSIVPGQAGLIVHEPIDISYYNHNNIDELIEKARKSIQSGIDKTR